jgi:aspartyl-tRNA(Asn)/glutamyl-tRNA(Gln) amidotransferase subunit A
LIWQRLGHSAIKTPRSGLVIWFPHPGSAIVEEDRQGSLMTPDEALQRIRRYNGRLRAFVRVFDRPLHGAGGDGLTFAVKDVIDVAGVPTGGGGKIPLADAPPAHARAVERLLSAGWTAVGKTHTVELAFGAWGTNRAVGEPWNPWDSHIHRAPGGSSSGSAAAVAAGLCDAALGTDTAGSVRIPAAVCGAVGLKPGQGLVSLKGVHPLAPTLDTLGVLAHDVASAARMLALISGPDGEAAVRPAFDAEAALAGGVQGRYLAAIAPEAMGGLEPEVERLYLAAVDRLREAGASVAMVAPFRPLNESFLANGVIMAAESWRTWSWRIAAYGRMMDPWIVRRFETGRDLSERQVEDAYARCAETRMAFAAWMAAYDAMLTPTCPIVAPPLAGVDEAASPLSRLTREANFLDLPAISVPCGLTAQGLPAGLQITGAAGDEASVVGVAAAFERVSGWNGRMPDMRGFER